MIEEDTLVGRDTGLQAVVVAGESKQTRRIKYAAESLPTTLLPNRMVLTAMQLWLEPPPASRLAL